MKLSGIPKRRTMKRIGSVLLLSIFIAGTSATYSTSALDETFYSQNNILFFNPSATAACSPTGSITTNQSATGSSEATASLPAATTKKLDDQNIRGKADQNKAAYMKGEAEGVPWAVLAALHYREGGMNPRSSIADGEPLGTGTSVDGIKIGATLEEDATLAARHLKEMAKSVYGKDLSMQSSGDDWSYAFLAYNRGAMYKNWNKLPTDSPYVMNGYDDSHMNMKWIDADSYTRPGGKKLNGISGKGDSNAGAMSVLAYLGGPTAASAGISCETPSGGGGGAVTGNIIETAKNFALTTPQQSHSSRNFKGEAKPEFVAAVQASNPKSLGIGDVAYADCGIFVSTVMRASGADTDFPPAGTWNIMAYLENNQKYKEVASDPSTLQPGDILIYSHGRDGHIALYSGPIATYNGQTITMIDASQAKRVPSYRPNSQLQWMTGVNGVKAFRLQQQ